jgi:hypothetical protein
MYRNVSSRLRLSAISYVVAALVLSGQFAGVLESQTTRAQDAEVVFVRPMRRAPDTPPAPLPELPSRAHEIEPLTFEVVTRRTPPNGAAVTERQRVSRTKDRIHVATEATEWLFERNPVDARRVSALLVHHPSRSIVTHEESDLRNTVGITGWAPVLMIGVDVNVLATLAPTSESRTEAGLQFRKHLARAAGQGFSEVWWNPEQLLPLTTVIRDGAGLTDVTVQGLRRGVDAALLRSPSSRFPKYRLVDLAEWLEGH